MLVSVANAARRWASSSDRCENSGIAFSRFGSMCSSFRCLQRTSELPQASYSAWTSEVISLTDAFASPNSIEVLGS